MKTITITIRITPELAEEIAEASGGNRNAFIIEAIKAKVESRKSKVEGETTNVEGGKWKDGGGRGAADCGRAAAVVNGVEAAPRGEAKGELSDAEKRGVLRGAKNISDVLQDAILAEAARRKNFLSSMDNDTFAKLLASRLPKESGDNTDLEQNLLSLQQCLAGMPELEDLSAELNRVRGELFKAEHERDMNLALLKHAKGKAELAELMSVVYRSAVEYTVDLVARRSLPGFGDGGGLPETAYSAIAREVEKELESLKLHGVKS